jgi:nucleoside-diphosphate-sugar epimerase
MPILVTGGSGFIGSNLLHHLVKTIEWYERNWN